MRLRIKHKLCETPTSYTDSDFRIGAAHQQHIGDMGGEQSVHSARGADQVHLAAGVADRGSQTARQDAGHVDGQHAARAVHHLQRQADHQLHQQVEDQVPPAVDRESGVTVAAAAVGERQ